MNTCKDCNYATAIYEDGKQIAWRCDLSDVPTTEDSEACEEFLCGEPCEDCISRADAEALFRNARGELHKSAIRNEQNGHPIKDLPTRDLMLLNAEQMIHLLPSVTPKPRTGWIPFTYRPATDEEKKDFVKRTGYDEEDIDTILDCQLPEDGETVLITDRLGNVEVDTFIRDCDGCYFECNCDMEDVRAWMPLPKPYDPQESEE